MTRREFDQATKENLGGDRMLDHAWRAYRRIRANTGTGTGDFLARRAAVVAATGVPTLSKASSYRRRAEHARDTGNPLL